MKKNSILTLSTSIFSAILCILLLIFCLPANIPMHINLNSGIDSLFSKWLSLISIILMLTFSILATTLKQQHKKTIMNALSMIFIFINLLCFAYYSIEPNFEIGMTFKIPLSILIFMPLSFLIIVWANLLKTIPFKSCLGIKSKYSKETEFLWTQIHYVAKDKFFAAGFMLLLISLIFAFFNLILVELLIFIVILTTTYLLVFHESKSMWKKYNEMKSRKDKLQKFQEKNKG